MKVVLAGYNVDSQVLDAARRAGVAGDQLTPEVLGQRIAARAAAGRGGTTTQYNDWKAAGNGREISPAEREAQS